ncbi:hypothetical protein GGS23DRAFT_595275 [Durotheca rogersii]|uniref:uncharacterized protein n=1 Tax=Durotheca rogersii TaxID=419775 RepID=UPI0022204EBE|nr:uncharacterized protein GGS23DRAFT_595275 [Durotheca rogersii]KAI5864552.1 hypothetical protein GGS23DRAFT_595275 [Durotheca rogersii]
MSLNGLDDAKVKEAHEAAVAEPGGWFLLKYASRDEVELLGRGTGGIVDIRGLIAKYDEVSPLYGFLRYRRRNVILKYLPEECSRLVQVHFNAVCERFAPYDTTFEISTAKDLKDSKLSAACSLHAASGSASSSTSSLRRRRLNEIAEEEEEEERERKRQSVVKEEEKTGSPDSAPRTPTSPERAAILNREQLSTPQETNFASTSDVPEFTGAERPTSSARSEAAPRLSSQSTRAESYHYTGYTYGKPKVKLGPRPSLDVNKRPSTAGNFRPIAAIPARFKFSRGSKKGNPEKAEKVEEAVQDTPDIHLVPSAPVPKPAQEDAHELPQRPATSSGASAKSTTASPNAATKETKMTAEKARLMKAMKLREKKMNAANRIVVPEPTAADVALTNGKEDDESRESDASLPVQGDVGHRAVSKADSGIAIDPPTPMTIHTEDTVSDSRPGSPTAATSSEIGISTRASSLSESTGETIHATGDAGEEHERAVSQGAPKGPREMENGSEHSERSQSPAQDTAVSIEENNNVEESHKIPEPNCPPPTATITTTSTTTAITTTAAIAATTVAAGAPPDAAIQDSIDVADSTNTASHIDAVGIDQSQGEDDAPKSPWGLPISKFSTNDPKSSSSQKSPTTPSLRSKFSIPDLSVTSEPVPSLPGNVSVEPSADAASKLTQDELPQTTSPETHPQKRKNAVGPIRTDLTKTASHPEASDPLLDDALMDELQSATVEEAKPMLVSKSPITPVFPNANPLRPASALSRAVSNPMRGPLLTPNDVSQSTARSVSAGGAAFLHTITRQTSNAGLQAKKSNLGSSISQRIKALEKLSSATAPEDGRPKTATPSSSFFGIRKPSVRDPSKSPSVVNRATSLTQQTPTPEPSREATPETPGIVGRERSRSVANRLSMFENPSQGLLLPGLPRGRPESVQVTARIIRDSGPLTPNRSEANSSGEYPQTELKQSPLVVDLQRADASESIVPDEQPAPAVSPKATIQERRDRKSISDDTDKKRRRSSLSIVRDFIKDRRTSTASKSTDNLAMLSPASTGAKSPSRPPSAHQTPSSFARRLSISSRRSSVSRERDGSATSIASPVVLSDSGSGEEDKNGSEKKAKKRATRFMRRLSNSLGGGGNRKNSSPHISPTVAEEDADQVAAASVTEVAASPQLAVVAYMGDVNVQFPDNLLWKRRSMCLDAQGFLILSAVQGVAANGKDKAMGAGVKRYHLGDFRKPYIPDVEVQELPNSVVLDLTEGSCLQIACGDRAGQMNVLQALQEAYQSHGAFGQ